MLRLIRPWASKLTPRASRQGPCLPDRDPIPNLPIALTQCHFTWCLGNIWFLAKKKEKGEGKKSPVSLSEEKNLNHYDHFNAHKMAQIHLTCLETGGWGFGLDSSLVEASSHGPCSLWACCAVRGSMGGRLSLLAPYDVTAGSLHGRGRGGGGQGGGRGKSFPSCRSSPQSHNHCLLFMQDPIKPGCRSRSALAAIWQPQLPRHLFYEPQSF